MLAMRARAVRHGGAEDEAALHQLGDDQDAARRGHELGCVGKVRATQDLARRGETGIDQ